MRKSKRPGARAVGVVVGRTRTGLAAEADQVRGKKSDHTMDASLVEARQRAASQTHRRPPPTARRAEHTHNTTSRRYAPTKRKRSLAFSHSFGSSGLSQEVRIGGNAKLTVPNKGNPFPTPFRPVRCPGDVRAAVQRQPYLRCGLASRARPPRHSPSVYQVALSPYRPSP